MVFEVFRGSGCLITFRHSKQQGENEHPGQLRSSQGFGEESKVTRFRSNHLKCHAPSPRQPHFGKYLAEGSIIAVARQGFHVDEL